jgi:hypothetical protein
MRRLARSGRFCGSCPWSSVAVVQVTNITRDTYGGNGGREEVATGEWMLNEHSCREVSDERPTRRNIQ